MKRTDFRRIRKILFELCMTILLFTVVQTPIQVTASTSTFSEDFDDAEDYASKLEREEGEGRIYTCLIPNVDYYLSLEADFEEQSDFRPGRSTEDQLLQDCHKA